MKITISILFCLLTSISFASKTTQLPEKIWRPIANIERRNPVPKWEGEILVKLEGYYSKADSLQVLRSIEEVNKLTETINLRMSPYKLGNLNIVFVEDAGDEKLGELVSLPNDDMLGWRYSWDRPKSKNPLMTNFDIKLRLSLVPEEVRQEFFTNILFKALYPAYWDNGYYYDEHGYNGPVSVFMSRIPDDVKPYLSAVSDFDRQIVKAVYSSSFSKLLPQAKEQFKSRNIPEWLDDNGHLTLIFPFVLVLFLVVGLFVYLYKRLFYRIKNKLLQFNAIAFPVLLVLGILIALYSVSGYELEGSFLSFSEIKAQVLATMLVGLPAVNIFRAIELFVNRKVRGVFLKAFILFLSISLVPGLIVVAFKLFTFGEEPKGQGWIYFFLIMTLVFTIIGVIRALVHYFIGREKQLKYEHELNLSKLRELKTKAELNALHSKINPHFLYNSLNSIAGLSKVDPNKTEHMALSLSRLFRYSINKEQTDWSTLTEELNMVNIYLDIEKVRFENRLEFNIDFPDDLKDTKIPRFLIQPLVENAVKHGISNCVQKGIINVAAQKSNGWLEISVADNGPDFPEELEPGFGLQSIYDKLEIMYPKGFELHFLKSPDKQILIKLS